MRILALIATLGVALSAIAYNEIVPKIGPAVGGLIRTPLPIIIKPAI